MEFSTSSQPSSLSSLENFEIVNLNSQAFEALFTLLEDKKIDCNSKELKKAQAENQVFLAFIKKNIEKLDPSSKTLPTGLLSTFVLDFFENSYSSSKDLQKLLSKHQLIYIVNQSKIHKSTQDELNNTITYYLEQYPDDYPYNKLIGFIWSKHSMIKNYLSKERLRDYISLTFIVFNSAEDLNFSVYEILKRIESGKNESEVVRELASFIEKKVAHGTGNEKIQVLKDFYLDFLAALKGIKKRNKISVLRISYLVSQVVLGVLKKLSENRVAVLDESGIKTMILNENLKIVKIYFEKFNKYSQQQSKIQDIEESQLSAKKQEVLDRVLDHFSCNLEIPQLETFEKTCENRLKTIEKVKLKSQELFHLNSIHNRKISKTKKLFKQPNGLKTLLHGDFLETEEELYRKNRDLAMRIKMIEAESRKVTEKKKTLQQQLNSKFNFFSHLQVLVLCILWFCIGVCVQRLLEL